MSLLCLYFQVHQPERLAPYTVFDVGTGRPYFDEPLNREVCLRVAHKCYRPTNALIYRLIERTRGRFKVAFSLSGVVVEQLLRYAPDVIDGFRALARTGCVEFLAETYWHSLSFLYHRREFEEQVLRHHRLMEEIFGFSPRIFRNTELIYSDAVAREAERMGYVGVLADGVERILGGRSTTCLYRPPGASRIRILLRHYRLSDDIAFRFSRRDWSGWPLTAEKFAGWLGRAGRTGPVVNLFLDYETFGEHHWADTGIFRFLERLPFEVLSRGEMVFATPSEVVEQVEPSGELAVPAPVSWADTERDLSAWLGNEMQMDAAQSLFALAEVVRSSGDPGIISDWRRLQASDHFYYMSTKEFGDGTVHNYFTHHRSPYDCFIAYMNVLNDLERRLGVGCSRR